MHAKGYNRNAVVVGLAMAVGAAGLLLWQGEEAARAAEEGRVLRHIVLFDLKDGAPVAEIETAAHQMARDIEEIQALEWGRNLDFNTRNDGYGFVLLVNFASQADLETYGPHPDHDAFRAVVRPHVERILVVDYWSREP